MGYGNDHAWLAHAVKKDKVRIVMGFFGHKLEAAVRTLRAHNLQVAVAGSQVGHGDGNGWYGQWRQRSASTARATTFRL